MVGIYSVSDKYFGKNKLFQLSYRQWCLPSSFPLPLAGETRRGLASSGTIIFTKIFIRNTIVSLIRCALSKQGLV